MKILRIFIIFTFYFLTFSEIIGKDLSSTLEKGWFLQDKNQDGFIDYIDCKIILPDNPSLELVRSASEIAFRLSFESEGISPPIVLKESEVGKKPLLKNLILLGDSNIHRRVLEKNGNFYPVPINTGIIEVLNTGEGHTLSIRGYDDSSLFYAVKNFFSRFPYLWEVIGRKSGNTFEKVRKDLENFFRKKEIEVEEMKFKKIVYENKEAMEKNKNFDKELKFYEADMGEVYLLETEISLKSHDSFKKSIQLLQELMESQKKGENTKILNYSSLQRLNLILKFSNLKEIATLKRLGFPERMLAKRLSSELVKPKIKPKQKEISLARLFTNMGLMKEEEKGIAKLDSRIVLSRSDFSPSVAEVALRLGLESTGITMPLTILDEEIKNFEEIDFNPIIIGERNRVTQHLLKSGKLKIPALKEDEGFISVIPRAFGDFTAIVMAGNLKNSALYFSKNLPYLWKEGKGGMEIFKLEDDINSFFKLRNIEGQASLARLLIQDFFFRNPLENMENVEINLIIDDTKKNLEKYFKDFIISRNIKINHIPRKEGKKILELEYDIPYEVDDFWKTWNEEIIKNLNHEKRIAIDVRVSEPPEIRKSIKEKIVSELKRRGFKKENYSLRVLSAYKQGFSWIVDEIIPKIKGEDIKSIYVGFPYKEGNLIYGKFREEPTRWLSELYPVDEIISKELNIPIDSIIFEREELENPVYKIKVFGKEGIILEESFEPFTSKRAYLEKYPLWGEVTITPGGVVVEEDGKEIFRKIIETDLHRFWNFYQKEVLTRLNEHIFKKTGGKPKLEKQPFFHTLKIELFASEPDYKLGIDEEMITSLESIHDEIYFDTLDFLEASLHKEKIFLEEKEINKRWNAPGKIVPVIYPSRSGMPGKAKIILTDYPSDKPKIQFKWKDKAGMEGEEEKILEPLSIDLCKAMEIKVKGEKVSSISFLVKFSKEENAIAYDMIEALKEFREKGFFREFIASNFLERISLRFQHESLLSSNSFDIFKKSEEKRKIKYRKGLIKFDHVTRPEEVSELSEILGFFPEIYTYKLWKSYEGRDIPVMEIFLTSPSEVISRNKLILRKPTLLLTGRQHGNEVSSTSYLLKLAELIATDDKWKGYLKKCHVVIHPMENPDGAALAHELQKITPYFCLHAGRYTSLGADVSAQIRNPETVLTEALYRNFLYERWKPDIYLNLHGYPSHEWVQQFSGYTPYLFRQYWIPKGWFAFITHLDHPGYPFHREASKVLLEYINREINSQEEMTRINNHQYQRYRRWAERWQPHIHFLEMHGETNLYFDRRSSKASKPSHRRDITLWEAVTEAMDETAQGHWLNFVCSQGLAFVKAHLDFFSDSETILHREEEEESIGKISITLTRVRPVKAKS